MKTKYYILLCFLSVVDITLAQVGINTNNPKGSFHVDGHQDNLSSGNPTAKQYFNDLVVESSSSNIGIGTPPEKHAKISIATDESVNYEICKGFRLKDGTEGNGNLLSLINTEGDIAWKKRISTVIGKLGTGYSGPINTEVAYTETYIELPPGKWLIRSSILLRVASFNGTYTDGLFAQLSWADRNTDGSFTSTVDALSGNLFGGTYLGVYSLAFGQTIINNTSSTTKTYYLITKKPKMWGNTIANQFWRNLGASTWGENAIIAFSAN